MKSIEMNFVMSEMFCTTRDCKNPATNFIYVENKGYPICKEHWDFGHKIHQLQVKWPKHRHKYTQACVMCGKVK